MTPSKRPGLSLASLSLVFIGFFAAGQANAQILYGVLQDTSELRILDPSDASTLSTLGTITHPNGVDRGRAIAVDPTTGTLYCMLSVGPGMSWAFGTLGLDASFSQIDFLSDGVRDMAFDARGKLWAVVGRIGARSSSLVSINTITGAVTLENGALPTSGRNKIAYVGTSDTLYILGDTAGPWELYSLSPASPTNLTQVPLSGIVLNDTSQPPMTYDPIAGVLRTVRSEADWIAITLDGVVTLEGPFPGYTLGGLAFYGPIFADGFESGDTSAWN